MKIEKLQPGMTVWSVNRYRMGNTNISSLGTTAIKIEAVDLTAGTVIASENGNPARKYWLANIKKWKAERPILIRNSFGQYRRPTREEKAALKAKAIAQPAT